MLIGCSTLDDNKLDGVATIRLEIPANSDPSVILGSCEGLVLERHRYHNGSGNLWTVRGGELIKQDGIHNAQLHTEISDALPFVVRQSDSNLCWAATLETAFRYAGYQYTASDFVHILSSQCSYSENAPATLREILFAASTKHTGDVSWPELKNTGFFFDSTSHFEVYIPPQLLPYAYLYWNSGNEHWAFDSRKPYVNTYRRTFVGAYSEVKWTYKSNLNQSAGGILYMHNTGEMIYHLLNKRLLLIGVREGPSGHTVLSYGADFKVGGLDERKDGGKLTLDENTQIDSFYILDPYNGDDGSNFYQEDGTNLLDNADFIYALDIR